MEKMLVLKCLSSVAVIVALAASAPAGQRWSAIVPLRSTREDVKRLVGKSIGPYLVIDTREGRLGFELQNADSVCSGPRAQWDVPEGTVLSVEFTPKRPIPVSKSGYDLAGFVRGKTCIPETSHYYDDEHGIMLRVFRDQIINIRLYPRLEDRSHACPSRQP